MGVGRPQGLYAIGLDVTGGPGTVRTPERLVFRVGSGRSGTCRKAEGQAERQAA